MRTVSRISIAPVKSLALQHPDEVRIESFGIAADRFFYLVDRTGRLFSGSLFGPLTAIRPEYDPGQEWLTLHFPDGEAVSGDAAFLGEPIETGIWGRPITGHVVGGAFAEALSRFAGRPIRLARVDRPGDGVDSQPISVLSDASVEELARRSGRTEPLDGRRFRMTVGVAGCTAHEEDTWIGHDVRVGEAVIRVTRPDGRCVVTTRDPETGVRDFDTLRAIRAYRGVRDERKIDFGVYARVAEPGRVRVGDRVEPI
ncbi:MAG: hypothetical protein A2X23_04810 [Chloroflexi bacterium GWC2_73_18]|nr:MAG: hypothetical protein A2X23_04810 [Chloroflexi bacterium GWC2_73_18]